MRNRTMYEVNLHPSFEYVPYSVVLIVGLCASTITAWPATWSGFSRNVRAVGSRSPMIGCRVMWEEET